VGAGAVGSFLGWAVATGGGRTTLVQRRPAGTPRAIGTLAVVRPDGTEVATEVTVVPDVGAADEPDLVIVAVKQYDLPAALESLAQWPAVAVLTAENGVGAEEAAVAARPGAPVLAASVTASVERTSGSSVGWLRTGGIGLAVVEPGSAGTDTSRRLVRGLARSLRSVGLPVRVLDDAAAMKWSKLVANLVGNATSAILDLDPAEVYADPALFALERDQLREALAVMRALGLEPVDLPGAPVRRLATATGLPAAIGRPILARVVGSARGGKEPSLRQAVRSGGPTEVGWLNGAVARAGAAAGVPVPVNDALARLVTATGADPTRRAWFAGRPDRLLAELGRD
jgi:2-dehydropantoate 2-reductase